jgi:hypothetical protein
MGERRNDLEITNEIPQNCFCRSQTRIDLLFTMSDITHAAVHPDCACELMFRGRLFEAPSIFDFHLVEPDGIEPTTSCLQSTRSPS